MTNYARMYRFAGREMLASEPADTAGLGWPITKTAPRWYRLGRPN
ncbi:MAG TPA: hypothetical protein VHS30_05065 [Streptosporangiaceae bacterium]|jgi:hypothetical protein|nr:hypothetical protein [Streptosporangiaceae bacterium]